MINFEYGCPTSLMETASLLRNNPGAILFAGGTDVLVRIKQRTLSPPLLIDLKGISELSEISPLGEHGLRIGATATLTDLFEDALIRDRHPVISQASATMACLQVRNRGTVGGNLANASPSADTAPPLMVLNAELEIFNGDEIRTIPIESFFTGPGENILNEGEILSGILVPDVPRRAVYIKHTLREAMDIAAVGVCLSRRETGDPDPRLVLGAVAPTPIRVPKAEAFLAKGKVKEAGEAAAAAAAPIDDVRSSADYRRAVISPLVERAYQEVFGK
jgi:carbon-monoxide dehydrogenase medium subunit